MRDVKANDARDALELHRTDLREGRAGNPGCVDNFLGDEHLARPRVLGDPRGEVHRLAEVVALLEEDRPGMETNVG